MGDQDKTPTDRKSTFDLVFERLDDLCADSKLAVKEAREANQMSSDNNRMLKALVARPPSSVVRASIPYAALFFALVAVIRAW